MTRILYLAHDLDDPATGRRVSMLETGGAVVDLVGFRRGTAPLGRPARVLGQTYNGRFVQRAWSAAQVLRHAKEIAEGDAPDVILVRSLEMLPLAQRVRSMFGRHHRPRMIYEVLDVHRLMVGTGAVSSAMRFIERRLCRNVDRVVVSSMRFTDEYLHRYRQIGSVPILVENKFWDPSQAETVPQAPPLTQAEDGTLTIGWFGILRCAASLQCLDEVCRRADGRIKLVLRGKPALDSIPDFHRIVQDNPHIAFHGPYTYPDDLAAIYREIDIAWLIDRMDAGANSDWLLPNRLYESGAHGVVPLALAGTETGQYLSRANLGLLLHELDADHVSDCLDGVDQARLGQLRAQVAAKGAAAWRMTHADCIRLVNVLAGRRTTATDAATQAVEVAG
ncbi:MAG: glycosyl transferase [Rhodobacterales bacterium]